MATSDVSTPDDRLRDDLAALRIDRGGSAPGRRWKTWLKRLGMLAAVAALVGGGLRALGQRATEVEVAAAQRTTRGEVGPLPVLAGSGYIVTGERYVSIGVRVAGRIDRYFVEEGQTVKAGDTLVQLDDRDYKAVVARTEAALEVARANQRLAEAELRRGAALRKQSVISVQEVDVLRTRAEVAQSTVVQLQAELDQARVNLDYTVLRAPTDGVVLAKLKEVGEIAVPGGFEGSGDLVRIANLGDLRAELDVNEADLNRVRLGQAAEVTPDAYPDQRYRARVVKLYPQVDRQKGTLRVEVRVLEPDGKLLPDMSVRIGFLEDLPAERAGESVVLVPAAAVQRDNNGSFVWLVDGEKVQRRNVKTSGSIGDQVRLQSGLEGGETIVVGAVELSDGARVRRASDSSKG